MILSAEEYPELPAINPTEVYQVPSDILRKGALASRFAAVDEKTPNLAGVHICNQGGKIAFSGTERHRIYNYVSSMNRTQL